MKELFVEANKNQKDLQERDILTLDKNLNTLTYNTGYQLSFEQIRASAYIQIAKKTNSSLNDVLDNYPIDYIETRNTRLSNDDFNNFISVTVDPLINHALSGKPAFMCVSDGKHYVNVALVPTYKTGSAKLSVVYINPEKSEGQNHTHTGKEFAKGLIEYLKSSSIELENDEVLDKSDDQQYDNCCGLAFSDNVGSIADHFVKGLPLHDLDESLTIFDNELSKRKYYKSLGLELHHSINSIEKISFTEPLSDCTLDVTSTLNKAFSGSKDLLFNYEIAKGISLFLKSYEKNKTNAAAKLASHETLYANAFKVFLDNCAESVKFFFETLFNLLTREKSDSKSWVEKTRVNRIEENKEIDL